MNHKFSANPYLPTYEILFVLLINNNNCDSIYIFYTKMVFKFYSVYLICCQQEQEQLQKIQILIQIFISNVLLNFCFILDTFYVFYFLYSESQKCFLS